MLQLRTPSRGGSDIHFCLVTHTKYPVNRVTVIISPISTICTSDIPSKTPVSFLHHQKVYQKSESIRRHSK